MPKKARLAIIGSGRQADLAFLHWAVRNKNVTLAGLADINEDQANRMASKYGSPPVFTDWRAMLDSVDIDAVCVITPPWAHAEPVIECARRGIHILCEKPMAASVEDCQAMTDAAAAANVILQIGFSERFDPGFEKMASLVRRGAIGSVFQLWGVYDMWVPDISKSPFKEGAQIVERLNLYGPGIGTWRIHDPRTNGGVYSDHSIHYVDLFRWILDDDVTQVSGIAQRIIPHHSHEDHASSLLRFRNGAAAYLESSLVRRSAWPEDCFGLLSGTEGCLRYKMDHSWYIRGYPHLYTVHARVERHSVPSFLIGRFLPVPVPFGRNHCMFKRQFDYFIDRVRGVLRPHPDFGDRWAADAPDGLAAVRVVDAVYRSSESAETIPL